MPRLLLVRHAEAAVQASGGDRERPLTARGWADAARLGIYLRESGLIPDAALSSPARRAQDTLAAILQEMPSGRPFISKVESSLYCADADTLLSLLPGPDQPIETLLIVGHNPGIAEFARFLAGTDPGLPSQFPAPCLTVVDLSGRDWQEETGRRLDRFVDFSVPPASQHAWQSGGSA